MSLSNIYKDDVFKLQSKDDNWVAYNMAAFLVYNQRKIIRYMVSSATIP